MAGRTVPSEERPDRPAPGARGTLAGPTGARTQKHLAGAA